MANNKREHLRQPVEQLRKLAMTVMPFGTGEQIDFTATVIDRGPGGLGIATDRALDPGFVVIRDEMGDLMKGVLAWSKKVGEQAYRAGIQFITTPLTLPFAEPVLADSSKDYLPHPRHLDGRPGINANDGGLRWRDTVSIILSDTIRTLRESFPFKTFFGYGFAWLAWFVILVSNISSVIPTDTAKAVLATTIWACIVWITESMPVGITGLMIPMMLFLTKAVPKMQDAFSGFILDVSFLCLGAFVFSSILCATRLDTRIALTVLSKLRSTKVGTIIIGFFSTNLILSVVIPAAVARAATLLPVIHGIIDLFGDTKQEKNAKKAIVISSLVYAPMVGGILLLTAHMPNVILAGLFDKQLHVSISWFKWLWLHLPIIGLFPLMYWMLKIFFKFDDSEVPGGAAKVDAAKKELGTVKSHQWIILAVFAFTAVMWALEDIHHIKSGKIGRASCRERV
jgi:hypothetical protein